MAPLLTSLPAGTAKRSEVDPERRKFFQQMKEDRKAKVVDFNPEVDLTSLQGKGVVVTGGASGFGALVTETFAKAGAFVTFLDISEAKGKELEAKWKSEGLNVLFCKCDVTSFDEQHAAFKAAMAASANGTLHHVFANAGVGGFRWVIPTDEEFDESKEPEDVPYSQIDISLTGAFHTMRLAMHYLRIKKQKGDNKSIIMTGSMASFSWIDSAVDYTGAKWGMRGIMKAMERRAARAGIRINMIAPNYMETGLTGSMKSFLESQGAKFGDIKDVAKACARFAVDTQIHGRVATIDSDGIDDLRDDFDGYQGNAVMEDLFVTGRLPLTLPTGSDELK